jgi:hypothetical protein
MLSSISSLIPSHLLSCSSRSLSSSFPSRSFLKYSSSKSRSYPTCCDNRSSCDSAHSKFRRSIADRFLPVSTTILNLEQSCPRYSPYRPAFAETTKVLQSLVRGVSSHLRSGGHYHLHRQQLRYYTWPATYIRRSVPHCLDRSYTTLVPSTPSAIPHNFEIPPTMAKKLAPSSPESSLSPVADDLIEQVESKVEVKTVANGRKRKATTTETKTTTKRTKKAAAEEAKGADDATAADESPKPKGRASKKVKVEATTVDEEVKVEEDGEGKPKVTKKKAATRTKKQVDVAPLAERTKGSSLRAGAHVSVAGG